MLLMIQRYERLCQESFMTNRIQSASEQNGQPVSTEDVDAVVLHMGLIATDEVPIDEVY